MQTVALRHPFFAGRAKALVLQSVRRAHSASIASLALSSSPVSQRLHALFHSYGNSDYSGEPVSVGSHLLQTAAIAKRERPHDAEATVAALLLDIGHLLHVEAGHEAAATSPSGSDEQQLGSAFVQKLGLPGRVSDIVAEHVNAKRYLCWKHPDYLERLSDASRQKLASQGGPMSDGEARAWEANPERDIHLEMREWVRQAKDPDASVPGFVDYVPIIDSLVAGTPYPVTDAQKAFWDANGFLVVKGLANYGVHRDVAAWAHSISQWPKVNEKWLLHWEASGEAPDGKIFCRAENFVNYHSGMNALARTFLVDVVSQLFSEPAVLFKEKINYKLPGGSGFAAHQDTPAYLNIGGSRHISAMVAIDDATLENGPLEIAPGRWGPDDVPLDENGVVTKDFDATLNYTTVFCEAGDVVFFDGWTPHRSSANNSSKARRAVFFTYNLASEGDVHATYYDEKHKGAKGFNTSSKISFQNDFQGTIVH